MVWYSTKVQSEQDLAVKLQELQNGGHTIIDVISKDGILVIISHAAS